MMKDLLSSAIEDRDWLNKNRDGILEDVRRLNALNAKLKTANREDNESEWDALEAEMKTLIQKIRQEIMPKLDIHEKSDIDVTTFNEAITKRLNKLKKERNKEQVRLNAVSEVIDDLQNDLGNLEKKLQQNNLELIEELKHQTDSLKPLNGELSELKNQRTGKTEFLDDLYATDSDLKTSVPLGVIKIKTGLNLADDFVYFFNGLDSVCFLHCPNLVNAYTQNKDKQCNVLAKFLMTGDNPVLLSKETKEVAQTYLDSIEFSLLNTSFEEYDFGGNDTEIVFVLSFNPIDD